MDSIIPNFSAFIAAPTSSAGNNTPPREDQHVNNVAIPTLRRVRAFTGPSLATATITRQLKGKKNMPG